MNAVDEYIPIPQRENEKPFLMPVEDVFSITGRGTVVTGRIETGIIHVGDPVEIVGLEEKTLTSTCTGVEMFRKLLDEGEAGDNVGLLLRGIDKKEVKRGMVVAKPGSITPHTEFEAEVYILKKEEGGRHTPFHNNYRPQFYLRTMDVTGEVHLPAGVDMVMPGDHVTITVKPDLPGSYQRRSAFRNPRGWPYGRCRSDPEDREIIFTTHREAVFRTASRF